MDLLIKLATIFLAIVIITWLLKIVLVLVIALPEVLEQEKFKRELKSLSKDEETTIKD